jgi:hypothetical protein
MPVPVSPSGEWRRLPLVLSSRLLRISAEAGTLLPLPSCLRPWNRPCVLNAPPPPPRRRPQDLHGARALHRLPQRPRAVAAHPTAPAPMKRPRWCGRVTRVAATAPASPCCSGRSRPHRDRHGPNPAGPARAALTLPPNLPARQPLSCKAAAGCSPLAPSAPRGG